MSGMSTDLQHLPQIGDQAPYFEFETTKGRLSFPEYSDGCWSIFFAHPANFSSAWRMYSTFLALKERWFNQRNTKLLALSTEPIRQNDWSDKVRRYIGIFLKAPVIEDLNFDIANRYGLASRQRQAAGYDRFALIIDPEGIIRLILRNPLPSIENAILQLERELDRLQDKIERAGFPSVMLLPESTPELSDAMGKLYKPKPAHFAKKKIFPN